jgi:hypothetical protein
LRLLKDSGIWPVKLFAERSNSFKLLKFPRFRGSGPVNKLVSKFLQFVSYILESCQFWFDEKQIRYLNITHQ